MTKSKHYSKTAAAAMLALTLASTAAPLAQVNADTKTPQATSKVADPNAQGVVNVYYRDTNTHQVFHSEQVTGKVGEHYNIFTPAEIKESGYLPDFFTKGEVQGSDDFIVQNTQNQLQFSSEYKDTPVNVYFDFYLPTAKATVTFIDDTTGTQLAAPSFEGEVHSKNVDFDYQNTLHNYVQDGYELVSSDYNEADPLNTAHYDLNYTVHLKHVIDVTPEDREVSRTVQFMNDDNKIFDTKVQTANFHKTTSYDHVTGQTTETPWDKDSVTFPAIDSKMKGYDFTGNASADQLVVTPDTSSPTVFLKYKAKTVNAKILVNDVNDSKNPVALNPIEISGKFGTTVLFDINKTLGDFEAKGYKVKSQNVGDKIKFDSEDEKQFLIELTHNVKDTVETKNIKRTINFVTDKGRVVSDPIVQTVSYNRTVSEDLVTHKKTTSDWALSSATDTWAKLNAQPKQFYTVNDAQVDEQKVTPETKDASVDVVYTPNKATAEVHFIDQVTGKEVAKDDYTGRFEDSVEFKKTSLNKLKDKGYTVISDDTAKGGSYISGDQATQFTVVLGHDKDVKTDTKNITREFNLIDEDSKASLKTIKQTVTYKKTTTTDKVTGEVTKGEWTTDKDFFDELKMPEINGYTLNTTQEAIARKVSTTIDSKDQSYDVLYKKVLAPTPVPEPSDKTNDSSKQDSTVTPEPSSPDEKANDTKTGVKDTSYFASIVLFLAGIVTLGATKLFKTKKNDEA